MLENDRTVLNIVSTSVSAPIMTRRTSPGQFVFVYYKVD